MPMWDQIGDRFMAVGLGGRGFSTFTVQLDNEHILAEIALTGITVIEEESHQTWAFITQVVSDNGEENFGDDVMNTVLSRTGVTSITFKIKVQYSNAAARWIISRWE